MFINRVNFLHFILKFTNVLLLSTHLDSGSHRSGDKTCQYVDKISILFLMEMYIVRSRERTRLRACIFDVSGEQSDRVIICKDPTTLCHVVPCSFADYPGISNFESFNQSQLSDINFQQYANFLGGFCFYGYFVQRRAVKFADAK